MTRTHALILTREDDAAVAILAAGDERSLLPADYRGRPLALSSSHAEPGGGSP